VPTLGIALAGELRSRRANNNSEHTLNS